MTFNKSRLFVTAFACFCLMIAAHPAAAHMHDMKMPVSAAPATTAGVGGPFSLTDQDGHAVTDQSFRGYYKLVFFGFTSCPDTCPVTLKSLARVLEKLGPAAKVKVLFITTDPDHDTPRVMKDYLAAFAPAPIIGLTGTPAQVSAAEQQYKVYAQKNQAPGTADYTIDHSSVIYFMNPENQATDFFGADESAAAMTDKIQAVMKVQ